AGWVACADPVPPPAGVVPPGVPALVEDPVGPPPRPRHTSRLPAVTTITTATAIRTLLLPMPAIIPRSPARGVIRAPDLGYAACWVDAVRFGNTIRVRRSRPQEPVAGRGERHARRPGALHRRLQAAGGGPAHSGAPAASARLR